MKQYAQLMLPCTLKKVSTQLLITAALEPDTVLITAQSKRDVSISLTITRGPLTNFTKGRCLTKTRLEWLLL